MSSDESDHDNGVTQYRVLIKPWRAPMLTPFLRAFDAAYRRSRFVPILQNTQGAHPHLRLAPTNAPTRATTTRGAVVGLPINAYNPEWLSTLGRFDRDRLKETEVYEFVHTTAILE